MMHAKKTREGALKYPAYEARNSDVGSPPPPQQEGLLSIGTRSLVRGVRIRVTRFLFVVMQHVPPYKRSYV
jgi:hypothetical protein